MKRSILILLFVCSSLIFNSCSNDSNQDTIAVLLVGEWQPRQFVYNCEGTAENITDTEIFCNLDRLVFAANGSFSATNFDTENNCQDAQTIEGTWNVVSNDLYLVANNEAVVAQIFFADGESLRLGDLLYDNPCNTDLDNREPSFYFYEYDRLN